MRWPGLRWAGLLALAAAPLAGQAQQGAGPADACIEVEVDGQRAPASFACLSQRLAPTPTPTPTTAPRAGAAEAPASEAIVRRPSNQLGLFNRAATGHRMGNQFGRSAFPQRP